jgi:hypothetical protein
MLRTAKWLAIAVTLGCLVLVASGVAGAQSAPALDTFSVNYFSGASPGSTTAPDQTVRIINPGADAPSFPPATLCAFIYVKDAYQELKECCGCLITPDGLLELSVNLNLTNNPYSPWSTTYPAPYPSGDIKIISGPSNLTYDDDGYLYPECDPTGGGRSSTGAYVLNIVPTPDLRAWGTHYQTDGDITETEFEQASLSISELDSLEEECQGIVSTGSGHGVCSGPFTSSGYCTYYSLLP